MEKEIKSKQNFKEYKTLMNQKFNWEDNKTKIFNKIRNLKCESLHCSQQLRIVEDQLRNLFGSIRVEMEKERDENG